MRYLKLLSTTHFNNPAGRLCLNERLCVAYDIPERGWQSWMVQLVKLPEAPDAVRPMYALMLDTSSYGAQPKVGIFGVKAGVQANISKDQLDAALGLVRQLQANARVILVGHHSFEQWDVSSWPQDQQTALHALLSESRIVRLLITAHTHEGGWYQHTFAGLQLYELNVGSLSDAPLHYRLLSFSENDEGMLRVISPRVLLGHFAGPKCDDYAPPVMGSGYAPSEQNSESDRNSDQPFLVRMLASFGSAGRHFLRFWSAKHQELKSQLLAYADVVDASVPSDLRLSYTPFGKAPRELIGRAQVSGRLRHLAACEHATMCSVQEKGHLLLEIEDYFWSSDTAENVRREGHRLRYCAALFGAQVAAARSEGAWNALNRSSATYRTLIMPLE